MWQNKRNSLHVFISRGKFDRHFIVFAGTFNKEKKRRESLHNLKTYKQIKLMFLSFFAEKLTIMPVTVVNAFLQSLLKSHQR